MRFTVVRRANRVNQYFAPAEREAGAEADDDEGKTITSTEERRGSASAVDHAMLATNTSTAILRSRKHG